MTADGDASGQRVDRAFWRGFPALLLAFAVAQLMQQIDVGMLARVDPQAPAAYVLLLRIAVADLVAMMAFGAVASVTVAQAARDGDPGPTIRRALGLAALLGVGLGGLGLVLYGPAARAIVGTDGPAALVAAAVPWFAAAAPLRLVNACAAFALHATGAGGVVVRWKLGELVGKAALNGLFLFVLDGGFVGCFVAGLLLNLLSVGWVLRRLHRTLGGGLGWPGRRWALDLLRKTAWEAQRVASGQILALATVTLFASPLIGAAESGRFNAFAAGSVLATLVFAPFVAFLRFLAMRFAGRSASDVAALAGALWRRGAPVTLALAAALILSGDWLGAALYGQSGPWWSGLVTALSLSLPIRLAANILRAASQASGAFAQVARIDGLLGWGVGGPLILFGLHWNLPAVAYAHLVVPEALALLWLWRRWAAVNGQGWPLGWPLRRVGRAAR